MSQHKIKAINSAGEAIRMKMSRAREYESEGAGQFVDGVFVFHPRPQANSAATPQIPAARTASLADLLAELPAWPQRDSAASFDGRCSVLHNYARYPLPSQTSYGYKYACLARDGAGML